MLKSTKVHVLDESSARRAKLSYSLSNCALSVQIYEDLSDFERFRPQGGVVLLSDDHSSTSIEDVARALQNAGIVLPIALYAEDPVPARIVEAMLSGAIDYLTWPLQSEELESAIRRIANRAEAMIERTRSEVEARARVQSLTDRESQVLVHMIDGISNKEIGLRLNISPRTVEIHRSNLLRKLNASSSAEALRIGIYAGLHRR